jgi:glycosyltransferase involved in cell wall biosynthesis
VTGIGERSRVLYLTAGFPFPLSTGYLRHFHLLRELACNHHVHLLSLAGPTFQPDHLHGVEPFVDRVSTFPRTVGTRRGRLRRLLEPARPDAASLAMAAAVDDELQRGAVDVAIVSGKETVAAADRISGRAPLVVDLCDATSYRLTQAIELAGPMRRAGLQIRRRSVRGIEQHLVRSADALVTISERDRQALHDEGAPSRVLDAEVIPNGIDLAFWQRRRASLGDAVVFCGNLAFGPNADAARRLVLDVMPHVWDRRPATPVIVIGRGAPPELVAQLRHPQVTVTGPVDDVRPHLERGAVFMAPLRIASGIQNKLLEALAMELPVVTTTVAAAGLRSNGSTPPIAVADRPVDQAAAVLRKLDGWVGRSPDRAGRTWVAQRFSWERSGARLAAIVDGLQEDRRASC